ncbi:MAG TPA: IclR family transcriptional regulator [Actinomycetota bacterium]
MRATDGADRVVRVLDALATAPDGLGVSTIARTLQVHRSTASRLLATLARGGLVERDTHTRAYRLGARVVGLAAVAVARLPVVSQARPELEALSALTSETANLAIVDGNHVVYVDQVTPAHTVVMASWVGRRSPVHASSSGKVLMAWGDPKAKEALLRRRLEPITDRTVTDPGAMRRMLDEARRRGYVASNGELESGLITIAAPVMNGGRAVAAVSISGPTFRIPARDVPGLGRAVREAAGAVGHRMAGRAITAVGSSPRSRSG